MSYLPTGELIEVEAESQVERFINIFASAITIAEVVRAGPKAFTHPVILICAATSLAIMRKK